MLVSGLFYDGLQAQALEVRLEKSGKNLVVIKEGERHYYSQKEFLISPPMANLPIVFEIVTGARIELRQTPEHKKFLRGFTSNSSKFVYWIENNKRGFSITFLAVVTLVVIFFKFGVPLVSNVIAKRLPSEVGRKIDPYILKTVQKHMKESKLPLETQVELKDFFQANYPHDYNVLFFEGGPFRANAFALSGKTIIFTDELVVHIKDERQLFGIFLHEAAHLEKRHVLQQLISTGVVNVFVFMALGNLEGLVETLVQISYTFISLEYSREFESEADEFAVEELEALQLPATCFTEGLKKLTNYYKEDLEEETEESTVESLFNHYLSTHPESVSRIARVHALAKSALLPCL